MMAHGRPKILLGITSITSRPLPGTPNGKTEGACLSMTGRGQWLSEGCGDQLTGVQAQLCNVLDLTSGKLRTLFCASFQKKGIYNALYFTELL